MCFSFAMFKIEIGIEFVCEMKFLALFVHRCRNIIIIEAHATQYTTQTQCQFAVLPEDKLKCSNIINKNVKNDNYKMTWANPAHRMGIRSRVLSGGFVGKNYTKWQTKVGTFLNFQIIEKETVVWVVGSSQSRFRILLCVCFYCISRLSRLFMYEKIPEIQSDPNDASDLQMQIIESMQNSNCRQNSELNNWILLWKVVRIWEIPCSRLSLDRNTP